MAVTDDTQFAALGALSMLASTGMSNEMSHLMNLGMVLTTNVASAMVLTRKGETEEAALIIHSSRWMLSREVASARRGLEAYPEFFAVQGIPESDQAPMVAGLERIITHLDECIATFETWLSEVDDDDKVRLDPTRHAFTATCETHVINPDPTAVLCCCCAHAEVEHTYTPEEVAP